MAKKSTFGKDPDRLKRLFCVGLDEEETDSEVAPTASLEEIMEKPGGRIGRYKLLSVLGEGGMGMVYLAEQEGQIKRRVALKVIKPGMDSKRVIARFETERQTLALLDHPNIAQVYDAGTTESGRPYFVMEYVKGLPITEYCDRHKLSIEDRLALFQKVCAGLHHAHQKGIIHRDIKPSNILVFTGGDEATPKIIDFGVAKEISAHLTERTLYTEESQLLGTPEYMSPEQVDMANEDVDTRSDIYSLGVLLYVLLTGVLPFDSDTLRTGGIERIRHIIRETDPKTPSTRLTQLGEEAKKLAESRCTEIHSLAKHLRKELEWIPMKAMRKDRSERYRSATELADDIENYLIGVPLIAGPPGTGYRIKKFVRRNRVLVGSTTTLLIVLVMGVVVSTILAVGQARARADMKLIIDFLEKDVLGAAKEARVGEATIGFMLDSASDELDTRFEDKPLIKARLSRTLGEIHRKLGDYEKASHFILRAIDIYEQYCGESHPDTIATMGHIGWVYVKQEKFLDMQKLFQKLIEVKQQKLGIKHPRLEMHGLAVAYYGLGRYKDAELLFNEILQIMERLGQSDLVLHVKSVLACVYTAQGKYNEAELLYKEYKIYTWDIANMYRLQKRFAEAESLIKETLQDQRMKMGERHFQTLASEYVLARIYIDQDRKVEAVNLTSESLKIAREQLREAHPLTLRFINARALLHMKKEEYDKAEELFNEALRDQQNELGEEHPDTLDTKNNLALLHIKQGNYEQAKPLLLEAVNGRRLKLGDTHPHTIESWHTLIDLYEAWNKQNKADEWRTKLVQIEDLEG